MFVPDRERKVAVANEIVHRVAEEFGLTVAPLHTITKRVGVRRTFFNSYGDLFHPNDRGYEVWASAFEPRSTRASTPWRRSGTTCPCARPRTGREAGRWRTPAPSRTPTAPRRSTTRRVRVRAGRAPAPPDDRVDRGAR